MSDDFLSRWSRRKISARRGDAGAPEKPPLTDLKPAAPGDQLAAKAAEVAPPPPLPAVESLTPDSDFTPFMRPEVDPGLRRQALRALMRDPRFNVMDGLDVYIDDYSKPDPIPPEWLEKLNQMARLGDYPAAEEKKRAEAEAARTAEPGDISLRDQGINGPVATSASDTSVASPPPSGSKES